MNAAPGSRQQRNQHDYAGSEPNRLVSDEEMVYLNSYAALCAAAKTDPYLNGEDAARRYREAQS